jgi:hypothetical protein
MTLEREVKDFLDALDRGYFGRAASEDMNQSAFIEGIRQALEERQMIHDR